MWDYITAKDKDYIWISGLTDSVDLHVDQLPHVYTTYSIDIVICVTNIMNLPHHTTTLCRAHSSTIPKQLDPSSLRSAYGQAP